MLVGVTYGFYHYDSPLENTEVFSFKLVSVKETLLCSLSDTIVWIVGLS